MNRIHRLVWALAIGLLAVGPADATPASRDERGCRAHIEDSMGRVRRNPDLATFSEGGWHRASFAPHLTTPLMAASFHHYCQRGGRLGYLDYARTFVRTNGFFGFSVSPDQAVEQMKHNDSLGSRATLQPHVVVLTAEMPRPRAFVSLTGLRLTLPELREGVVHIDARDLFAVVRMSGRTMALWQGQWVELDPERAP